MRILALFLTLFFASYTATAEESAEEAPNEFQKLDWHVGPQTEDIASKATLKTSEELAFLDEANSTKFLELTGNIPDGGNFILVSKKSDWWAVFSFDPIGYVKDDEKIDGDALLQELKDSDEASNEERQRLGIPPLYTEGWSVAPHYDASTKRLEWGLKLNSEGETVLNYTIRLLGRTGVMNVTLVSSPETLEQDVKELKATLPGFEFNNGERYAEYQEGDRVAEYGLAALIAGGAAAVATKKGFWAALVGFFAAAWKFIAVAAVGVGAWLRSLFSKKS